MPCCSFGPCVSSLAHSSVSFSRGWCLELRFPSRFASQLTRLTVVSSRESAVACYQRPGTGGSRHPTSPSPRPQRRGGQLRPSRTTRHTRADRGRRAYQPSQWQMANIHRQDVPQSPDLGLHGHRWNSEHRSFGHQRLQRSTLPVLGALKHSGSHCLSRIQHVCYDC